MYSSLLSSGYGDGNFFSIRKTLYLEVRKTQSSLTEHFLEMFNRLSSFQGFLHTQRGGAVTALQSNLVNHMKFLSESAPIILTFIDTTASALFTLEASDLGDNTIKRPTERQPWHYESSPAFAGDSIDIHPESMAAEARLLKENFTKVSEVLTDFNSMIEDVLSYTTIPWGEFSCLWREAKRVCGNIVEEMGNQIDVLIKKANVLTEEMVRVDHYLGSVVMEG